MNVLFIIVNLCALFVVWRAYCLLRYPKKVLNIPDDVWENHSSWVWETCFLHFAPLFSFGLMSFFLAPFLPNIGWEDLSVFHHANIDGYYRLFTSHVETHYLGSLLVGSAMVLTSFYCFLMIIIPEWVLAIPDEMRQDRHALLYWYDVICGRKPWWIIIMSALHAAPLIAFVAAGIFVFPFLGNPFMRFALGFFASFAVVLSMRIDWKRKSIPGLLLDFGILLSLNVGLLLM